MATVLALVPVAGWAQDPGAPRFELVEPDEAGQPMAIQRQLPVNPPTASSGTLTWELVEPEPDVGGGAPGQLWSLVEPGQEYSESQIARDLEEAEILEAQAQAEAEAKRRPRNWIVGAGGGARLGIGEPTFPMVYGRLGRRLGEDLGLSLRPSYIFGNSDSEGQRNNEGAFQMPLTLDFAPDSFASPFFGVGIATNTDSNGKTEPMVSVGMDLNITPNLTLAAVLNYIFQSGDQDGRDVEALTLLYLRF